VSTGEMLHTMAANAVAPFVLCSRLLPLLAPSEEEVARERARMQARARTKEGGDGGGACMAGRECV
jgi:hypothetical protein